MMVVGEPGIGKTALCEQLATYVTLRGGKYLVGHCYEEGSLSLPYLAFVEAMRSYVLSRETRDLRKELGTGAADVARIVSEVREKLKVEPKPQESPEEERYRLMQAVTSFLTNAAKVQPLLIVLEDLHDSDKGTLEMLTHVSRNLSSARLLIIGTYRDVEVDRTHPLSASLAELRRVATFDRVLLRGLNADEVRRMLESITREEVPWSLAEAVHRQTEGNPLFVQEVLRYLVEEGLISREEGQWKATQLEMSIPEGLRDVVGKRLSSLSQECNRILSIASVIGREFRLAVLQKVADVSDDELFTALEEAKGAAVVEERSAVGAAVTYRFTHAFFRQTLYEEIIAPRRIRLHQQVGQALEEIYARRLEEHAAELAEHFSYSPDAEGLAKAVNYGEMAAERANNVYAYGEAVRLLEQTLKVQEVLDPEDKGKRCDLLTTLGNATMMAGQPNRTYETVAPEALSLAEATGDDARASRVCLMAAMAFTYERGTMGVATPEAIRWVELADRHAEAETAERAQADSLLGYTKSILGQRTEAFSLVERALSLARQLDDPNTFWMCAAGWMNVAGAPHHDEDRLRIAEELEQQSRVGVKLPTLMIALPPMGSTFRAWGQYDRAKQIGGEILHLAEVSGQPNQLLFAMFVDCFWLTWEGHLEEAVEVPHRLEAHGEELGLPEWGRTWAAAAGLRPRLYVRKADEALQFAQLPTARALCLAHLSRIAEVTDILQEQVVTRLDIGTLKDETPTAIDVLFLEAAVLVGHKEAVDLLLQRLSVSRLQTTGANVTTYIPRHLGAAAALLGRPQEARQHYQEAIRVCTEIRFRPELALTRLQLAELLLEHYPDEKSEALEHLDFAINEFREMKMQPSLERALRHKEILGA